MAAPTSHDIEHHPDIAALRARSERATSNPPAQFVEALSLLAGLYLAVSPWIRGFNGMTTLTVNNLITGLALVAFAIGLGSSSAYERTHGMCWAAAGIGLWTIAAPWVVVGAAHNSTTIISNSVVGGCAVLLALATAIMAAFSRRRGPSHERGSGRGYESRGYESRGHGASEGYGRNR
ncbi:SPW repeat protein [Streptomyces sp. TP-A0874]|uniref:SPW repeat protein n=1 Tax=Streptomyces sp. TP-A0874 TaxID=549819 RepID=UPI000853BAB1|nr:SPW repeat protein [Streptomyces sp. TP-A0874]